MAALEVADAARANVADALDLQLSPLGLAAMDAIAPRAGHTVLDIGCGAGQTVLQLVGRVGSLGRVIGVDVAPRVLDVARARTAGLHNVQLMQANATTLALPDATADRVFSRFGVMALDPPTAAFANFRRMTKPGGRLGFVCWRSFEDNELDWLPVQAAGIATPIDRTPFKFERRAFLLDTLHSAGWREIQIKPHIELVSTGSVAAMTTVLTTVGALGKILRETPALHAGAVVKVQVALEARQRDGDVRLQAATWIVTATA